MKELNVNLEGWVLYRFQSITCTSSIIFMIIYRRHRHNQ